ncbi:MAG: phosphatase PAP2 family protein [Prevotella sp.]|nr:phosphatase PAP2 family protein [Candidatus Equicola faecalis]
MSWIQSIDNGLITAINFDGSTAYDFFWWTYTDGKTWALLAFMLLFYVCYCPIKSLPTIETRQRGMKSAFAQSPWKQVIITTLAFALVFLLCDQIPSSIIKPIVSRLRPSHNPDLVGQLSFVDGYMGGRFGFPSNHACNGFGCAMLITLLFRRWKTSVVAFLWAGGSCYSRMYLGVHYPTDILCGAVLGIIFALLVYSLYKKVGGKPDLYRHAEPWGIPIAYLLTVAVVLFVALSR